MKLWNKINHFIIGNSSVNADDGADVQPVHQPDAEVRGLPGRSVQVWLRGEHVASGVVDQAAEDGSVLWIAAEGISTRRIFDKSSGYQIWV